MLKAYNAINLSKPFIIVGLAFRYFFIPFIHVIRSSFWQNCWCLDTITSVFSIISCRISSTVRSPKLFFNLLFFSWLIIYARKIIAFSPFLWSQGTQLWLMYSFFHSVQYANDAFLFYKMTLFCSLAMNFQTLVTILTIKYNILLEYTCFIKTVEEFHNVWGKIQ